MYSNLQLEVCRIQEVNGKYKVSFYHPIYKSKQNSEKPRYVRKCLGKDREYAEMIQEELIELIQSPELWKHGYSNLFHYSTLKCFFDIKP
ncbi:hypothetical protein D3C81_1343000 [compost metagenome]